MQVELSTFYIFTLRGDHNSNCIVLEYIHTRFIADFNSIFNVHTIVFRTSVKKVCFIVFFCHRFRLQKCDTKWLYIWLDVAVKHEPEIKVWFIFTDCMNQFLSWLGFVPLSRMTYCTYLVHPVVITMIATSSKNKVIWDELIYVSKYIFTYL